MRVRHKMTGATGDAWGKTPDGLIRITWYQDFCGLRPWQPLDRLVFIVPAGRREISQLDAWKYHALPHPKEAKPLRTHEFLARKPGSMICVCGVGYREPLHGFAYTLDYRNNPI